MTLFSAFALAAMVSESVSLAPNPLNAQAMRKSGFPAVSFAPACQVRVALKSSPVMRNTPPVYMSSSMKRSSFCASVYARNSPR